MPVGSIDCLISFTDGQGTIIANPTVEGWPSKLPFDSNWNEVDVNSQVLTSNSLSTVKIVSKAFPLTNFTIIKSQSLLLKSSCKYGKIKAVSESHSKVSVSVVPIGLNYSQSNIFAEFFTGNYKDSLDHLKNKVFPGLFMSFFFLLVVMFLSFFGRVFLRKTEIFEDYLGGFLLFSLALGGLHYFLNIRDSLLVIALVFLTSIFVRRKHVAFDLQLCCKLLFTRNNISIFLILPQFFSTFYFNNIGLLQTDTFNYRAQVKLIADSPLLSQVIGTEGNGFRSIDYSLRSAGGVFNFFSTSESVCFWALLWIFAYFCASQLFINKFAAGPVVKLMLVSIPLSGVAGLWVEGYLSRFSYLIAAYILVSSMVLLKDSKFSVLNYAIPILAAAYGFSIIPVFLAPVLALPLFAFSKKHFKEGVVFFLLTLVAALPASLWMRNLFVSIKLANDVNLDSIARYIIVPNYTEWSFASQLTGAIGWHSSGLRNPTKLDGFGTISELEKIVPNLTPFLVPLGIGLLSIILLYSSKLFLFSNYQSFFILLFLAQLVFMEILKVSLYLRLMYLITLFPLVFFLLASQKISKKFFSFAVVLAGLLSLFSAISESSLWLARHDSKIANESYWANHYFSNSLRENLSKKNFVVTKGEFASQYSYQVKRTELVLSMSEGDCLNCELTSTGVIDKLWKDNDVVEVVIYGNCPDQSILDTVMGPYSICRPVSKINGQSVLW